MNAAYLRILFLFILVLGISVDSNAQRGEAYRVRPEPRKQSEFVQNLWYGGGATLGFASSNIQSDFIIGFFPMAGYKLTPELSAGLRVGTTYNHTRFQTSIGRQRFNLWDLSVGPLARYKVLPEIFIHSELEFLNDQYVVQDLVNAAFDTRSSLFTNPLLGLGYVTGNFEMLVLYSFNESTNSLRIPIVFRAGYVVNF